MIFTPTLFSDAWVIEIEPYEDSRGFFARSVCSGEFTSHGLNANFVQQSISWNPNKGTLRGLHFQKPPFEEDKLVRVSRGAIFDVIVDIRKDSTTCGKWYGVELSANNHRQLYIPKGFAHGFQTLQSETEVLYQMTVPFHPDAACGIRWDDSAFNINWPLPVEVGDEEKISVADSRLPVWEP